MRGVWSVCQKELKQYATSPMTYILMGLFILIVGWAFFNLLSNYVESLQHLPEQAVGQISFVQAVVYRLFGNINFVFLFICPLITMKLIAEEKKNHTLEFLLTAPISSLEIVLGKFLASFIFVLVILILTLIFPLILNFSGFSAGGNIFSGYLALILNVSVFLSIGIFASSLTENQIVAAITTIVFILIFWLISWASQSTSNLYLVELFKFIGLTDHFDFLVRGLIRLADVVYYLSLNLFFLWSSIKVMESRNW